MLKPVLAIGPLSLLPLLSVRTHIISAEAPTQITEVSWQGPERPSLLLLYFGGKKAEAQRREVTIQAHNSRAHSRTISPCLPVRRRESAHPPHPFISLVSTPLY